MEVRGDVLSEALVSPMSSGYESALTADCSRKETSQAPAPVSAVSPAGHAGSSRFSSHPVVTAGARGKRGPGMKPPSCQGLGCRRHSRRLIPASSLLTSNLLPPNNEHFQEPCSLTSPSKDHSLGEAGQGHKGDSWPLRYWHRVRLGRPTAHATARPALLCPLPSDSREL